MIQEAQRRGLKPQWDIWNEPDHHFFWKRSPEQFNETWRRAYVKIRQADPVAVIVGPSWSNVHPGQPAHFTAFIRFCKENNVVPDYVLLALSPQVERAKIDLSCHAIWGNEGKGNLDGILFDPHKAVPKGQWWAYQRYAALSDRLIATTPSGKIDLVASRDERGKTVQALLGNSGGLQGDVTVRFRGLDKAAYVRQDNQVHVVVERIPEDQGKAVAAVQMVVDGRLPIRDNSLDVTIPWTSDQDAFSVRSGPGQP